LLGVFVALLGLFRSIPQGNQRYKAFLLLRNKHQAANKPVAGILRVASRLADCFLQFLGLARAGHELHALRQQLTR
jgi:hypothetical protein